MSQYIKPSSVESYLTGIAHYLAPYYPKVYDWRTAQIVHQTLQGCKKLYNTPIHRKRALTLHDLSLITNHFDTSDSYDDRLFIAILLIGFYGLLRLGELVYPNDIRLDNPQKMIHRHTLTLIASSLQFQLPYHKADRYFEGNVVIIRRNSGITDPIRAMAHYIVLRDHKFARYDDLWIREDGIRPRRKWFLDKLALFKLSDVAGHSLRSGGATLLAERGVRLDIIQALGRWSSDTFCSYIRVHPSLLHAAISQQS
ncbi:hypothetical protein Agabi119p4_5665 [Agaricus bisporus var. burnettii]|uniref:Tyr recombinase domain-containing protein n=1 Tax=Agaricus bisporus var. burnettii TaxID=192524 RepID=A0A8H7F262_AGABI|nr:hypothetical protein Agabi119p4_5665 [Agaricus bisporus var. burnettii]